MENNRVTREVGTGLLVPPSSARNVEGNLPSRENGETPRRRRHGRAEFDPQPDSPEAPHHELDRLA
ncbi:MAG TPA: hypothetical protein VGF08_04320 [Terriglobales bacterium]